MLLLLFKGEVEGGSSSGVEAALLFEDNLWHELMLLKKI